MRPKPKSLPLLVCEGDCNRPTRHQHVLDEVYKYKNYAVARVYQHWRCALCDHVRIWGCMRWHYRTPGVEIQQRIFGDINPRSAA